MSMIAYVRSGLNDQIRKLHEALDLSFEKLVPEDLASSVVHALTAFSFDHPLFGCHCFLPASLCGLKPVPD